MAQRTVITLVDDLDHKEIQADGQTITFAYQGIHYEIDLSEKNAKRFDKAMSRSWPRRVESAADHSGPRLSPPRPTTRQSGSGHSPTASRSPTEAAFPPTSSSSTRLLETNSRNARQTSALW